MNKAHPLDPEELVPWVYAPQDIEKKPRRLPLRRSAVLVGLSVLLLSCVVFGVMTKHHTPSSSKDLTLKNLVECEQLQHQCKRFASSLLCSLASISELVHLIVLEQAIVPFARARDFANAACVFAKSPR